jgi:molybdopterin converting factor small subunit
MIHVRVRVLGALQRPGGKDDFEVELQPASRIEDLLLHVGYARAHLRFILSAVNGVQHEHAFELSDRDQVTLVMPTSGG